MLLIFNDKVPYVVLRERKRFVAVKLETLLFSDLQFLSKNVMHISYNKKYQQSWTFSSSRVIFCSPLKMYQAGIQTNSVTTSPIPFLMPVLLKIPIQKLHAKHRSKTLFVWFLDKLIPMQASTSRTLQGKL